MKKSTQRILILAAGLLTGSSAMAQSWCTPTTGSTTMNSYGSNSPVITNVTFNTINRTTAASLKELYVNTGVTTNVTKGQTYNFSMTYTQDQSICTVYAIRVYIDWGRDGSFTNVGTDLPISLSGQTATTITGTITVPLTASTGTTRMRVCMKMDGCGHTAIDPCVPPENFGWHGEIEDYSLNVGATGIQEMNELIGFNVFPNPVSTSATITVHSDVIKNNSDLSFFVYDVVGQEVTSQRISSESTVFDRQNLPKGVYFYKLQGSGHVLGSGKLIVQ